MTQENGNAGALGALGILAGVWGYNWVVMKIALNYAGPFQFAAMRSGGAALSLMLLLVLLRQPLRPRHALRTAALGMLQTAGFVSLITWALSSGGAGKTSVLAFTMPFWVLLFARMFLGERVRGLQWLAVALAFAGLMLIIQPWQMNASVVSSLLAVAAGVSWGASVIVAKKIPVENRWQLLSLTAWQMLMGASVLVVLALLVPAPPVQWNAYFIGALAYNIIPANALAWLLWLYILQKLPAGLSGLSSLVVPVVGVCSAWLQLGERPGALEGTGMLMIILALALISLRSMVLTRETRRRTTR
ncbi:MAG: EamA family transporter [Gammaproteobacteria bacterium]|jgi:drug/metabolite transporter (DMT)-like permease